MSNVRGRFLSFEGLDGTGKSSQLQEAAEFLRQRGIKVLCTREPGGTPFAEKIREFVLSNQTNISIKSELMLMFTARQLHLEQTILPALTRGIWVLCDRFTDSSFAFQGGGRGVPDEDIAKWADWVHGAFWPDLTFLLDAPVEIAQGRRRQTSEVLDRIESEHAAFHEQVRAAFLRRAEQDAARIVVLDACLSFETVRCQMLEQLSARFFNDG